MKCWKMIFMRCVLVFEIGKNHVCVNNCSHWLLLPRNFRDIMSRENAKKKNFINTCKNKYIVRDVAHVTWHLCGPRGPANIHDYFFERYPSILVLFLSGTSFTYARSFNKPTITPKTSFTLLHSDWYDLEFGSKAFLLNSMETGTSLAWEITPGE